jgi:thiamine kinase-like enzyme
MADQKDQTQNFPTITRAAYFQNLPDHSPGYLEKTPEAAIQLVQSLFEGYSKIDPSEILVKILTGGGGNFAAWKVSSKADPSQDNWFTANPDLIPSIPAVVIHSRTKNDDPEHLMEKKMSLMQKLLWENDITVPRLCQGNHWWVEPAIVDDLKKEGTTDIVIAKIIANVHKLPTDWYKEIRDHIKGMYPCLTDASDGSHVWIKASKSSDWVRDGWLNEDSQKFAISCDKEPISTAGKRIVSCHMDFHYGNLVSNKELEKNYLVDFEYSCVSYAATDLAFCASCLPIHSQE